ncbi:hypothetical protein MLD38_032337 [Melastoma candidum]|uniref:Uncharacterized protein n=1 Tax=Melastoma candidum TaxID=119954 RepID=A0ACB9M6X7_9MYRT|nr:hypothetical protein MLD38_032337 [Melastoma candidum]
MMRRRDGAGTPRPSAKESCDSLIESPPSDIMTSGIPSSMAHLTMAASAKPKTYFHMSVTAVLDSDIFAPIFASSPISLSLNFDCIFGCLVVVTLSIATYIEW